VKIHINALSAILLASGAILLGLSDLDGLLLASGGLALIALASIDVPWDRKIGLRELKALVFEERHSIPILGRVSGSLSTVLLLMFVFLKIFS
jgi:hypothetical protein